MMKNRFSVVGLTSFIGLAISFLAGLSLFFTNKSVDEVSAAIDYSECETAVAENDKAGLKSALYNVVKNGSAKSYNNLWSAYDTVYKKSDNYIKDYYSNISTFTLSDKDSGSGGTTEGDKFNREHTIPKSWWGGSTSNQGADIFIVVPADKLVNNKRSDNCLGMVGNATYSSKNDYSKLGTSTSSWDVFGSPVFEPNDEVKGDLARIVFYSVIKYDVSSWTNGNGSYVFSGSTTAASNFGLTENAIKLFSYWSNLDKPDDWERTVNTRGNTYQGNPNPFIDHPEYANTLWGDVDDYTTYGDGTPTVSITPSTGSVAVNSTVNLTANASGGSGNVTWSILSGNSYVSLNTTSGNSITVTGNAAGTATIQASYSGQTATCSITVTEAAQKTLSSISVNNPTTSFNVGDSFTFGGTVTANFSDSTSSDVTSSASFTGYNMSATGNQTVTVSYTYGGTTKTSQYQITVNASGGGGGESDSFSGTYNYGNQGTGTGKTWSLTDCSDQNSYWLCPNSGDESVALIPGIFSGKTITSNVVITINSGTYGSGGNPSSSTFAIYTSSACTSQVTATQTGTLPTSKTYTDAIYTVSLANSSGFSDDLAIKITKPGKQIRLVSITVEFDYETSGSVSPTLSSISLNTENVQTEFTVGATFTYSGLVVTAHYSDSTSATVTPTSVSSPNMSTTGNKTVTVTYLTASETYSITVSAQTPTSISASVSNTYYVGDTIVLADITVTDNLDNNIEGFSFANNNYQFTYSDAASGGSLTNKTFTNAISYNNMTCSLTVQVQRKAYVSPQSVVDELDLAYTGQSGSTYGTWSSKTAPNSTAYYTGHNAGGNSSIQLRSSATSNTTYSNEYSGIVSTASGGTITKVTVKWNGNTSSGRVLNIYGKNTAYSSQNDLFYDSSKGTLLGTIVCGTSTELTISGNYAFVGIRSNSGAMYLDKVTFTYGSEQSPENVANYIMYEDTTNQCTTKFDVAKGYFEALTSDGRATFMTSNDYVISTARTRFEAWARNLGKTINQSNGDYVISNAKMVSPLLGTIDNNKVLIIIIASALGISSIGGYFFLRRKELK